jgi:2-dehydropantoate 2-reductase
VAGKLAQAGHDVSVVARGAQLTAIQQQGLRILFEQKTTTVKIRADSDPAKLGPQDYVFVAVKGQNLPEVAERIAPLLGKDTGIVTAMNGVPWWFFDRLAYGEGKLRLETLDPGGRISKAMPTSRIVGCVIHLAASTPEPGLICHNMGSRLILGEPAARTPLARRRSSTRSRPPVSRRKPRASSKRISG